MRFDSETHHRRSIRLKDYDYANAGAYFVTICTHKRQGLFGDVIDGKMRLNDAGIIVRDVWLQTEMIRPNVILDVFVVMPNHIHGIVVIARRYRRRRGVLQYAPTLLPDGTDDGDGASSPKTKTKPTRLQSPTQTIGAIIRGFKSAVTKRINAQRGTPGTPVWQRNYYESIIRSETSLNNIRYYIQANPRLWEERQDRFRAPGQIRDAFIGTRADGYDPTDEEMIPIINDDLIYYIDGEKK